MRTGPAFVPAPDVLNAGSHVGSFHPQHVRRIQVERDLRLLSMRLDYCSSDSVLVHI